VSDDTLERPTATDPEAWAAYWTSRDMEWRIEPEIPEERQQYLAARWSVKPDIETGIYPFRDESGSIRLSRGDVEWLLAYHKEHVHFSIYPCDARLVQGTGLDLRGADLRRVNLSGLPLTGMRGGISSDELSRLQPPQQEKARKEAAVHLESACLIQANLEAAILTGAHLDGSSCFGVHLEGAYLQWVSMQRANLMAAWMEGAVLLMVHLEGVFASMVHLEGAILSFAHLEDAQLVGAFMAGTVLIGARIERANLQKAHLEGANLRQAILRGALLSGAQLTGRDMPATDLERIRKWRPNFLASLPPADLSGAIFDDLTHFDEAVLGDHTFGSVKLADAHFNGVNLAVVNWTHVEVLGDEREAREAARKNEYAAQPEVRLAMYQAGVRANRQLAVALRSQGLSEEADRFTYNAQKLQQEVFGLQRQRGRLLLSWGLALLAGYGYRLWRILAAYGIVLVAFTILYWLMGVHSFRGESGAQALWDSFLVSLSAIHGRTTFEQLGAWSPAAWVAAVESVCGIVIEGVFVAMLVQRFFGGR
jgi:uncharacterized protein YjbI with pentapeptide repeats